MRAMVFSVSAPESFVPMWRRITSGDSMEENHVGSISKMPLPPEVVSMRQPPCPSWSRSMPFVVSGFVVLEPT